MAQQNEGSVSWVDMNAHKGCRNIVGRKEMVDTASRAVEQILGILTHHCGPYGRFAMQCDPARPDIPPVFTKDGINIVKGIEYINPLDRILRDQLVYIGKSAERVSGDGTTSAMMITAHVLLRMLKDKSIAPLVTKTGGGSFPSRRTIDKLLFHHDDDISYQTFITTCRVFKEDIARHLELFKRTYEDIAAAQTLSDGDAVRQVAERQAYTSAHGDSEVVQAAVEVFTSVPKEAWSHIVFAQDSYENNKRITIERDDTQYTIKRIKPINNNMLNSRAGTEFHCNSCRLMILDCPLGDDNDTGMKIQKLVKLAAGDEDPDEADGPLVVVCHGSNRYASVTYNKLAGRKVAIFLTPSTDPIFNDLVGAQCVADIPSVRKPDDIRILKNVKVDYGNDTLKLNGLYTSVENRDLHPLVVEEDSRLARTLSDIEQTIDQLMEEEVTMSSDRRQDVTQLRRLYNNMRYRVRYVVKVGGSVRDNLSSAEVLADTLLAVRNSLVSGFVPAGNIALLTAVRTLMNDVYDRGSLKYKLASAFKSALKFSLRTICTKSQIKSILRDATLNESESVYTGLRVPVVRNADHSLITEITTLDGTGFTGEFTDELPIQPASLEPLIVSKFIDVMGRLLYTDHMVVAGALYDPGKSS